MMSVAYGLFTVHVPSEDHVSTKEFYGNYDYDDDDDDDEFVGIVDQKNVLAKVGNVLLISTFKPGWWSQHSYVEAYDTKTGQLLWIYEQEYGYYFYTFLVIDHKTIVLRSYEAITALNIETGQVLWKNITKGSRSFLNEEGWY